MNNMLNFFTHSMRKKFVFLVALLALLLLPVAVSAQDAFDLCNGQFNATEVCESTRGSDGDGAGIFGPNSIVTRVTETIIFIAGAVAVLMIVIGGFRYVISNGDPQATQNAKNTILYALIGVVIAISAELILRLVLTRISS